MPSLATVDDLETVAGPVEDSVRAQRLLDMASAVVERWTGRSFVRVEDDEITFTVDDGTMRLPNGPIESISSIVDANDDTIDPTSYDEIHGYVVRSFGYWPCGTYTITYTHGYDPIPDDVILAVCQMVQRVLSGHEVGVRSESIGEASRTWDASFTVGLTLAPVDLALLSPFRRQVSAVRVL